jgi:hypothetical protein
VGSAPLLPALRKKSARQFNFDKALSADRKVSGGAQKLHFCMGQPGDAAVQKYSFCTPGQP